MKLPPTVKKLFFPVPIQNRFGRYLFHGVGWVIRGMALILVFYFVYPRLASLFVHDIGPIDDSGFHYATLAIPDSENGFLVFSQLPKAVAIPQKSPSLAELLTDPAMTPEKLRLFVRQNTALSQAFRQAARRPHFQDPGRMSQKVFEGLKLDPPALPYLPVLIGSKAFLAEAKLKLLAGNAQAALEDVRLVDALSRKILLSQGDLISKMVGIALHNQARKGALYLLQSGVRLQAVQSFFSDRPAGSELETLRYVDARDLYWLIRPNLASFSEGRFSTALLGTPNEADGVLIEISRKAIDTFSVDSYQFQPNRFQHWALNRLHQAATSKPTAERTTNFAWFLRLLQSPLKPNGFERLMFDAYFETEWASNTDKLEKSLVEQMELEQAVFGIREFVKEHGAYPETLEQAAPQGKKIKAWRYGAGKRVLVKAEDFSPASTWHLSFPGERPSGKEVETAR